MLNVKKCMCWYLSIIDCLVVLTFQHPLIFEPPPRPHSDIFFYNVINWNSCLGDLLLTVFMLYCVWFSNLHSQTTHSCSVLRTGIFIFVVQLSTFIFSITLRVLCKGNTHLLWPSQGLIFLFLHALPYRKQTRRVAAVEE